MKKILSLVVALIVISCVNASGMERHSPLGMSVIKNGSVVKVFYRGEQSGKVRVTIYNEDGDAVFMETMRDIVNFMRPYNFSRLPKGDYTIEVNDETGTRTEKITYGTERAGTIAHVTCLDKDQNRYMLSVVNKGYNTLRVNIYDRYNKLLYADVEEVKGNFAKVYDFDHLEGQHVFEVIDGRGNVARLVK